MSVERYIACIHSFKLHGYFTQDMTEYCVCSTIEYIENEMPDTYKQSLNQI